LPATGLNAVASETSNTDPFMMLTTPIDHYLSAACFFTAQYCAANKASGLGEQ
jgi:hypothetical protein